MILRMLEMLLDSRSNAVYSDLSNGVIITERNHVQNCKNRTMILAKSLLDGSMRAIQKVAACHCKIKANRRIRICLMQNFAWNDMRISMKWWYRIMFLFVMFNAHACTQARGQWAAHSTPVRWFTLHLNVANVPANTEQEQVHDVFVRPHELRRWLETLQEKRFFILKNPAEGLGSVVLKPPTCSPLNQHLWRSKMCTVAHETTPTSDAHQCSKMRK